MDPSKRASAQECLRHPFLAMDDAERQAFYFDSKHDS